MSFECITDDIVWLCSENYSFLVRLMWVAVVVSRKVIDWVVLYPLKALPKIISLSQRESWVYLAAISYFS